MQGFYYGKTRKEEGERGAGHGQEVKEKKEVSTRKMQAFEIGLRGLPQGSPGTIDGGDANSKQGDRKL